MKISRISVTLLLVCTFFMLSCGSVPITGRSQFNILPNYAMLSMSYQQYNDFLRKNKLSMNQEHALMVKRVGGKIQKAVERYFAGKNLSGELQNYEWEFNLVESPDINAWAMPGGKVVVYEGIIPIAQNDTGLAVVMGHEIAHAIAKHGSERMSQALITQLGGAALSTALKEAPEKTRKIWNTVYGVGTTYGLVLPFSRLQESEADYLGLIFMVMSGYNPEEAIGFWQRMSQAKEGQPPPEFMSTHPSDETRIRKIIEKLPEVMRDYG